MNADPHDGTGRRGHLVGSIPASDTDAAMGLAESILAERLHWVPDGETGERRNWVIHIIEGLRAHPDLEIKKQGDWSDYDDTLTFRVRRGHKLSGQSLDFGHVRDFRESFSGFQALKARTKRDDLRFQVGIPGDFDMAGLVLGPLGALRHRKAFRDATVAEIKAIHELGGSEVVFQIEVPFELVFVAKAPKLVRPLVAAWLGRQIAGIAKHSPVGSRFGVHLCLGDMNHKAIMRMTDVDPVVALANAVAAAWPPDRPLEYVHAPFAGASQPPPLGEAFYAPLSRLRLPASVRFIAGFAHEDQPLLEQQGLLQMVERMVGRTVDVSTACGLGRRSLEAAEQSMRRTHDLAAG
jgi:hypothetical protein